MTFTYGEDLTVERDFVRFHTGDTVEAESYLSDELITSLIAVEGSKQKAVIASLKHIVTKLSQPDFTADWLQVSNSKAREGYMAILMEKRREFGLPMLAASVQHVRRPDSDEDELVDYDA